MYLNLETFDGIAPRLDKALLPRETAQVAENCRLLSGKLEAWYGLQQEYALVGAPPVASIYHLADTYWLESASEVDYAKGPIASDTSELTLFTGTDRPRVTDLTLANTGAGAYPRDSLYLGVPAPDSSGITTTPTILSGTVSAASTGRQTSSTSSLAFTAVADVKVRVSGRYSGSAFSSTRAAGRLTVQIKRGTQVIAEVNKSIMLRGSTAEPMDVDFDINVEGVDSPPAGAVTYDLVASLSGPLGVTFNEEFSLEANYSNVVEVTLNSTTGLAVNQNITISSVTGMTDLNGTWPILSINGSIVRVGCSTLQTYTAGGSWTQVFDPADSEDRSYVFTYTTVLGGQTMEGAPSDPTSLITVGTGQLVAIASIPGAPAGDYDLDKVRIYRTAVGTDGSTEYLYVGEINVGTTTYNDSVAGTALGEVLPSEGWLEPPTDMVGIVMTNDGVAIGFAKNVIYPSEPFQVHAYPVAYQKTTDWDIVKVVPVGIYGAIVLTEGSPYMLSGRHPADYVLEKVEIAEPCLSGRGAVDMGTAALYPSPNGLVAIGPGKLRVVTEDIFTQREWADYHPETIIAARYGDNYVGFYDNGSGESGGFVFNVGDHSFTTLDFVATGIWAHPRTGELFLAIDGNIKQFNADSANPLSYTWRSKRFTASKMGTLSVARVTARRYPVTLKIYAQLGGEDDDGVTLVHTQTVLDGDPFRLSSAIQYQTDIFEIQIEGTARVSSVEVGSSFDELNYQRSL